MKFKFKINNKPYEVDLLDIHSQPITAIVNGEKIDVWLEEATNGRKGVPNQTNSIKDPISIITSRNAAGKSTIELHQKKVIQSPIPGVVIAINVRSGDQVQQGQELCVIEAMKMKNSIRSPRSGTIKLVNIRLGQAVQHRDILFEFTE